MNLSLTQKEHALLKSVLAAAEDRLRLRTPSNDERGKHAQRLRAVHRLRQRVDKLLESAHNV